MPNYLPISIRQYQGCGIVFRKTDIYDDLRKAVDEYKPDLIGITLVEDTFKLGMSLLDAIEDRNIPVIAGGIFVNFFADSLIKDKKIDMLCFGEGEEALVECSCRHIISGNRRC